MTTPPPIDRRRADEPGQYSHMAPSDQDLRHLLDRLFRYALALSHDRALAEDLVQDACLAVARRGGPWEIAYLMRAVRNKFIDLRRRERVLHIAPLDPATDADLHAVDPDPVFPTESIDAALATLGPSERELVYLAVVEDRTTAEIATLTGHPRGTVLSTIYRAKEKLRRTFTAARGMLQ